MDLGLAEKGALITGGSRGLGREVALALAREGTHVAICARDIEALNSVAGEVRSLGVDCHAIAADLTESGAPEDIVRNAVGSLGRLDILVNNAAAGTSPSALNAGKEALLSRINDKAAPAMLIAQQAVPHILRSGEGSIIFVGGLSARMPATKHGPFMAMGGKQSSVVQGLGNAVVANFAKHLSDEVGALGVTVNVVHPGFMATERGLSRLRAFAADEGLSLDEVQTRIADAHPINRMLTAGDVAPLVVFLASRLARAVTGQSIAVDGGMARVVMY